MPSTSPESRQSEAHSQRSWMFRGRAGLILIFVVLVAASFGLNTVMPPVDLVARFDGRRPFVYWYSGPPGFDMDFHGDPYEIYEDPIKFMNLDTGEITSATRAKVAWSRGTNANGERTNILVPLTQNSPKGAAAQPTAARVLVDFKNMDTGASRHVEFDMPGKNHDLVNTRYVVSRDSNNFYAVDLEDSTPQVFSIALANSSIDLSVNAIYGTELLCQLCPPTKPNSSIHTLELFKIASHQIQLVKTIELGGLGGYSRFDGQLLNLSADGESVEFRSLDNLELAKTVEISEQILAEHDIDYIDGILLHGTNKQTSEESFFHLLTQTRLNLPRNGMQIRTFSAPGDRYCCFSNSREPKSLVVYDMLVHRVCLQIPHSYDLSFLDDGRFAVCYPACGVTTIVYDLQTGKSIRHAPYQWLGVALAAIMVGWFGWCIAWLVISAREGTRFWVDLAMIFVVLPGVLASVGLGSFLPADQNLFGTATPISYSFVVGACEGLLCVSAMWLGLSQARRSIQVLPVTLIFATLVWWLGALPGVEEFPYICTQEVALAFLHVMAIFLASVFLRKMRSRRDLGGEVSAVSNVQRNRFTLHDLFIYIACSAVVVAATKPFFESLYNTQAIYLFPPKLFLVTPICFFIALTVFSRSRRAFLSGCVLTAFAWIVLVCFEVSAFSGVSFARLVYVDPTKARSDAVAAASTFLCALAFRVRQQEASTSSPTKVNH